MDGNMETACIIKASLTFSLIQRFVFTFSDWGVGGRNNFPLMDKGFFPHQNKVPHEFKGRCWIKPIRFTNKMKAWIQHSISADFHLWRETFSHVPHITAPTVRTGQTL